MSKRRRATQLSMLTLMGAKPESVRVVHAECCRIEREMRDDDGNVTELVTKPEPGSDPEDPWHEQEPPVGSVGGGPHG